MEEKELQPAESMAIISSMIDAAKNRIADDGFLFIFWGWNVLVAAMTHYLSIRFEVPKGYLVWPILMPMGGLVSIFYGMRSRNREQVRSYVDVYLGYNWMAFLIALFITLGLMPVHGITQSYFVIMLLYGIATFISGGLLHFRPLVIGSIFSFAFALISVFSSEADQLLCISGAIFCSYLIPGYLLRKKYRSQENV